MNKYLKETIWFILPFLISVLFTLLCFGIKVFNENTIDINVHDTYFVLIPFHFVIALGIVFMIMAYSGRVLHHFLKNNRIANYLFIVIQIILILSFSYLMIFNHSYTTVGFDSETKKFEYIYPIASNTNMTVIQLLLVLFLVYSTVKADRKFKTKV
ncbi:hypothetical protein [Flavobacterium beibuense]|uniref:hypothetical protein n=1 Tax=Flavobacterium beibuense TaxID=657326 RepID=UPI003A91D0C6